MNKYRFIEVDEMFQHRVEHLMQNTFPEEEEEKEISKSYDGEEKFYMRVIECVVTREDFWQLYIFNLNGAYEC